MDKELIVVKGKVIEQERGYSPEIGKDIGYEAGAKMVKRHYDENPDDVIAHFMGSNILKKILNQSDCIGIRIFYALNEIGLRQVIIVGVDQNGKNIISYQAKTGFTEKEKKAIVAGSPTSCPPYCDQAGGSIGW